MSIKPVCDKCGKELKSFGGIFLSPPDRKSMVRKYHVCRDCSKALMKELD